MPTEDRILLADDDDVGRYVIATMLRRAGFAVDEVSDGGAAVEAIRADPPDLAVLDVKMPVMDGLRGLPDAQGATTAHATCRCSCCRRRSWAMTLGSRASRVAPTRT